MIINHPSRGIICLAIALIAGCGSGSGNGSDGSDNSERLRFRKTKEIQYSASGDILNYTRFEYDGPGNVSRQTDYEAAGTDGNWFTDDDVIRGYGVLNMMKSEWNYYSDNTDGKWSDGNDLRTMYRDITTDSSGMIVSEFEHRIGADMIFNTADDSLSAVRYVRSSGCFISLNLSGMEFGPDSAPFTPDDTGGTYTKRICGSDGLITEEQFFWGTGPDGVWFTSDDISDERVCYVRDGVTPVKTVTYSGPGPDGVWKTGDDEIDDIAVYAHGTAPGEYRIDILYGPGKDGQWETRDDSATENVRTEIFDADGNLIRRGSPGHSSVGYEYQSY